MTKIPDGFRVVIRSRGIPPILSLYDGSPTRRQPRHFCRISRHRHSEVFAMKINRIFATGILFLAPVFSQNVSPKLAQDLPDVDSRGVTDVIVQFTNPASDDEHRNIASLAVDVRRISVSLSPQSIVFPQRRYGGCPECLTLSTYHQIGRWWRHWIM